MADKRADELSGGQRQRVASAGAYPDPELLGRRADRFARSEDLAQIMRLNQGLCAERKLSASSTSMTSCCADVRRADRRLQLGEIVYDGPPNNLTADVLTKIYGEEDCRPPFARFDDEAAEADVDEVIPLELPCRAATRMAGLT